MSAHKISDREKSRREHQRILSYSNLQELKGIRFSRQWIRKLIAAGKFPRSIKVGEATTGFLETEIDEWISDCVRQRDEAAA